MRKILISTNMYKGSEFGQVLPYLKRFPGQVGVEVCALQNFLMSSRLGEL